MDFIEVLGSGGSKSIEIGTTSIQISHDTVIDAGNLIHGLGDSFGDIRHIFLTHAHMDHICDIPFLAEDIIINSNEPLKIYALPDTINDIKRHIFNNKIWPDFSQIKLMNADNVGVEFVTLDVQKPYPIEDISLTPVPTNHTSGSCGYIVTKNNNSIFITSDTYISDKIWDYVNNDTSIHSLCIDMSFSSKYNKLAEESKHMTPKILSQELTKLKRDDLTIYLMHQKSFCEGEIVDEIKEQKILGKDAIFLADGDKIFFENGKYQSKNSKKSNKDRLSIEQWLDIVILLSSQKDIEEILETILEYSMDLTLADGGTLYLVSDDDQRLEFKVVRNKTLNIKMDSRHNQINWDDLALYKKDGSENLNMVSTMSVLEDRIINIDDVYDDKEFDFSGTKKFDSSSGYRSKSMLVVPMKNHENRIIGALQLINKIDENQIVSFDYFDQKLIQAMASGVATVLTKDQLIGDMERLLEAFLLSINMAIEAKSKYTAGHISKMVAISEMIVNAINKDKDIFADKNYNQDELKTIRYSALLHDIGKIATPEYIVNKATKLETIYDRIETVKMKAEIRKRDAYIRYLEAISRSKDSDKELLYNKYKEEINEIDCSMDFIKKSNIGSEYFDQKNIDKIHKIAKALIAIDGKSQNWLTDDEVENLTIQRGTLLEKERKKINEHAKISLQMLKKLPFPKKYKQIPDIAASHHEHLDGSGYPRGLKGDEISFEARILAIADIFEALIASDRPYKKALKLSEATNILVDMAKANHIDKDILIYIYKSGLYLQIAKKFMEQENIDEIDLSLILSELS